jgi:hypothetical protein
MSLEQEIDNNIDIKILGVPPPKPGMPFLNMISSMDGWKKLHEERSQRPLLYLITS